MRVFYGKICHTSEFMLQAARKQSIDLFYRILLLIADSINRAADRKLDSIALTERDQGAHRIVALGKTGKLTTGNQRFAKGAVMAVF